MIDKIKLEDLYGVTGVDQPFDPKYAIVDAGNLVSRHGYKATDNPYAKISSLKDCQDYKDISDTDFNTILERMQKSAITSVVNSVFDKPDFKDRQLLYKNAFNKTETDALPNGFVGYEIKIDKTNNTAFEITRVLLDFSGTGNFDLLLFNTSQKSPVFSKTITITTDHQEEPLNWVLNDTNGLYKGKYYLGYLTQSLTIVPFKRDYENANIKSTITNLCIDEILVAGHSTATLWDVSTDDGYSETIGVNPDITVYDDYTDQVLQNERLFANAINMQFQISFISQVMASIRSNGTERRSKEIAANILLEINGASDGDIKVKGLRPLLFAEIAKIRTEIERLNKGYFGQRIMVRTIN